MMRHEMSDVVMRHEMSDVVTRNEISDRWWVTWDGDMRWVTWDQEIRWVTWDRDMRWVTWDEWRNDETWDEWHVINWLWPYTFCEFPCRNPFVNFLFNPFLIPWGQDEWCNNETWDEWHGIETEMSERHPETLSLSFCVEGRCRVGISYCGGGWQRSPVIICDD